jgi:hypothetical protein
LEPASFVGGSIRGPLYGFVHGQRQQGGISLMKPVIKIVGMIILGVIVLIVAAWLYLYIGLEQME